MAYNIVSDNLLVVLDPAYCLFVVVIDLRTPATVAGSDPRIPLKMQSPSEGFQLVFY